MATKMKVWFVDFPTFQYKEDVKALAASKQLRVINSRFRDKFSDDEVVDAKSAPKLTKIKVEKPKTEEAEK